MDTPDPLERASDAGGARLSEGLGVIDASAASSARVIEPGEDAEERARRWRAEVYRADVAQLTPRAVVMGMLLGGVMTLSNLYVGLKIGWSVGVTITACILAYALFSAFRRVVPGLGQEFTIVENNMMSSVASAAGCMSSSVFASAVPALYLAVGQTLSWPLLTAWAASVSLLGVFMAIPMKRQQIDVEQLPFPSGIATAETLIALHTRGVEAGRKAWALGAAGSFGALVSWFREAHAKWIPFNLPGGPFIPSLTLEGQPLSRLSLGIEPSVILLGAGAIIGIRAGVSLLVSALVCYGVVGPYVLNHGFVGLEVYRQKWALWPGVGLLVSSGLTAFLWRWRARGPACAGSCKGRPAKDVIHFPTSKRRRAGSRSASRSPDLHALSSGQYFFRLHRGWGSSPCWPLFFSRWWRREPAAKRTSRPSPPWEK
jgi:hypothetical protein